MITPAAVSPVPTGEAQLPNQFIGHYGPSPFSELTARCYHAAIYSLYFGYPICQGEWARFLRGFSSSKVTTKWRKFTYNVCWLQMLRELSILVSGGFYSGDTVSNEAEAFVNALRVNSLRKKAITALKHTSWILVNPLLSSLFLSRSKTSKN